MKIHPECIVNIPELECPKCRFNFFLEKAETRRFNGTFCINFYFRCRGCNMGLLLKSNKRLSEEAHQSLKRDGFDVVINPSHGTQIIGDNSISEIDCKIIWWSTGEEIEY